MLTRDFVRWAVLPVAMIAACALLSHFAVGADSGSAAAHMDVFTSPDGVTDFALSIKPGETAPAGPRDVVVLFNTSASQTGEFRSKAIETLKGLLAGLAAGDRVHLMAVDLNANPLTATFAAPNSKQINDALTALEARAPLGASDMEQAINAAASSFAADSKNARAVVYIGDGRSSANLLDLEKFRNLAGKLAAAHIPLTSYLVGARVNAQLPGALAVQTGGAMIVDSETLPGGEAGRRLAAAADTTVLWPTTVAWPAEMTAVFPKQTPPLRSDRETVLIGTLKGKAPSNVEISVEGAAGPQKLAFAVPPSVSDENNSYLARLVEQARTDGGVTLPLVGSSSLAEARQEINAGVRNLARLGREALSAGNVAGAERLVGEALRSDPNDADALALKDALAKRQQGGPAAAAAPVPAARGKNGKAGPKALANDPPVPPPPGSAAADLNLVGPGAGEPPAGALAESFQHDRRIIAQVINAEVQNTLSKARSLMSTDPDAATQQLKLTLEKVRQTSELNPDVRDQLVDVLQATLREASRRKIEVEYARQQRLENSAAAQERLLVTENLLRNEQKVQQLMQRFNSLMNEGRYTLAEEAAAVEAKKLVPESPVPRLAELEARQVGYYVNFMKLRDDRWKGVVDTLYQTEKAHVPFPDEPPIVYPDAEVWQQLTARRKEKWSAVDLSSVKPAEKKIRDALKSPTKLEFIDSPLSDVIDYLKDYHGIEIQLDKKALDDVGIGSDTPITKSLNGISLRSALRLLLKQIGLTYVIQDEVLLITTPEDADNRLITKVYPVGDLVIPVTSGMGMMGGMGGGMMGGMGGGMGGMGGGMMGGMGGMGGGMMGGMGGMGGGMMGGMGGMGMFNLPRELLPKVPPGGFQAFAVQDDLNVKPKADAAPAKSESPAAADNRPAKIEIDLKGNAKPEAVWNEYFAKNQPQPAAVRDAVRRLMGQQKFDHVIALISAALRERQAQPWMYEALSLALDAAGRPKAEIERAVMSAVDFVDNTADLMYIGAYLSQLGMNGRALQVYRQAAAIDPVQPEPYMLGLRAARALDDLNGLKWASLGIVGQAWPKEHANVWQAGVGVANEVLAKLKAENRTKEADEFKAALDEAVQRDCVVIVTWTGEADLDLLVEEPSGTVCSLRSPRTIAGGVMLGEVLSQTGRDSFGGHSEAYACPKGFDGPYRVLVRRVWGNVTAGRVNVEVINHYLASNAVDISKKIPLERDEALVEFNLANGRRKEPLRDQQVANAAIGQLAMNRQILAQQLAAAIDPSVIQSLATARALDAGMNGGVGGLPFGVGGAVGYQPVITVLPEGAMMSALAVISADRRYVRITPTPFFSGVSQVNTFNMATGVSGSSTGGTGNQGYSGSSFGSSGTSGVGSSGF